MYANLSGTYAATPPATWGQQINDNFNWLNASPSISIAYSSYVPVLPDTVTTLTPPYTGPTNPLWNSGSSRIQIPSGYAGTYMLSMYGALETSNLGNGRRYFRARLNGTDTILQRQAMRSMDGKFHTVCATAAKLSVGDYIQIQCFQASSITLAAGMEFRAVMVAP